MNIQIRSSSGITLVPIETSFLTQRKVFIEGEINTETASTFFKQIMFLNQESKEPIKVFINSEGGQINAGMQTYDIIQSSAAPIKLFCIGHAYSMAAVLLACGNHGRYMLPHSELMLHEPLLGNKVGGNSSSIKSIADSLIDARKKLNRILAKHTGKTEEEVEKSTSYDHYFSPEEAIEFGLCDGILDFQNMIMGG